MTFVSIAPAISAAFLSSLVEVGVMLSAFGVFWTGEGLGVPWRGADLSIVGFAALFLLVALAAVRVARFSAMRISS